MDPIRKTQLKALDRLGALMADLEVEQNPREIEAKLYEIHTLSLNFYMDVHARVCSVHTPAPALTGGGQMLPLIDAPPAQLTKYQTAFIEDLKRRKYTARLRRLLTTRRFSEEEIKQLAGSVEYPLKKSEMEVPHALS